MFRQTIFLEQVAAGTLISDFQKKRKVIDVISGTVVIPDDNPGTFTIILIAAVIILILYFLITVGIENVLDEKFEEKKEADEERKEQEELRDL